MKSYTYTTQDGSFAVGITWNPSRSILRIESGPDETPQEMIAEWQGLSGWGARDAIRMHATYMIGTPEMILESLEALGLPIFKTEA